MARAGPSQEQRLTQAPRPARVFFALWPDDGVRDALYREAQSLHRDCGGRVTHRENVHLTLVFVGDVAVERLAELKVVAGTVRGSPFELVLDQFGYWRHNRIVWASLLSVPEALRELVGSLESRLQHAGFEFDQRPYAPHLTLLRDARAPGVAARLHLDWAVRDFVLVESARDDEGPAYRVVARWELSA
jgi:RNA 2',3'-cyclic 3'-phosphodiesterase